MHVFFEVCPKLKSDCPIHALSWMGRVPDSVSDSNSQNEEEEELKLNSALYYHEGWLSSGNTRGIVGVTYTNSYGLEHDSHDEPDRTNFNLRGHRSEVKLVKWNEPYQKLATCDSSGIIFVWIKFEGRWSIELINDRNTPVTHFSWSHDGRMALICYQDGFVLVGSVGGQRFWSLMLNISAIITAGIFAPDDQQVYFGTSTGQILVMDIDGSTNAQVTLLDDTPIRYLLWSCPKFKMDEGETSEKNDEDDEKKTGNKKKKNSSSSNPLTSSFEDINPEKCDLLTVVFHTGLIYLLTSHDDVTPVVLHSGLKGMHVEWTNSSDMLMIAGHLPIDDNLTKQASTSRSNQILYRNVIKFFTRDGKLRYTYRFPPSLHPVSALTRGHNDSRLFVAMGPTLYVGRMSFSVGTLNQLSSLVIKSRVAELSLPHLPLPKRMYNNLLTLYGHTIKSFVPDARDLREFVCKPPPSRSRLRCTMIRHDEDLVPTPGASYTLYLEFLGGLVPLLKGKRTSKIRPEFVIYDPQSNQLDTLGATAIPTSNSDRKDPETKWLLSDSSDTEHEDICASPRLQRRRKFRKRMREKLEDKEMVYLDNLPEHQRLVEVTSNIWGTKFKLHGVAPSLPSNLGQVTYKTSLLHLEPRKMTLIITELRDDIPPRPDPSFNPNVFSEDEEGYEREVENAGRVFDTDFPIIAPRRTPSCYFRHNMINPWTEDDNLGGPSSGPVKSIDEILASQEFGEHTYINITSPDLLQIRQTIVHSNSNNENSKAKNSSSILESSLKYLGKQSPSQCTHQCCTKGPLPSSSNEKSYTKKKSSTSRPLDVQESRNSRGSSPSRFFSRRDSKECTKKKRTSDALLQQLNTLTVAAPPSPLFNSNHQSITQQISPNRNNGSDIFRFSPKHLSSENKNDVIKFIDEESGESDSRSFSPSPARSNKNTPLNSLGSNSLSNNLVSSITSPRKRARSKSVGQLSLEEIVGISGNFCSSNQDIPIQFSTTYANSHNYPHLDDSQHLMTVEEILATKKSSSNRESKKNRSVNNATWPKLMHYGKSRSLDSSLLMLNKKNTFLRSHGNKKNDSKNSGTEKLLNVKTEDISSDGYSTSGSSTMICPNSPQLYVSASNQNTYYCTNNKRHQFTQTTPSSIIKHKEKLVNNLPIVIDVESNDQNVMSVSSINSGSKYLPSKFMAKDPKLVMGNKKSNSSSNGIYENLNRFSQFFTQPTSPLASRKNEPTHKLNEPLSPKHRHSNNTNSTESQHYHRQQSLLVETLERQQANCFKESVLNERLSAIQKERSNPKQSSSSPPSPANSSSCKSYPQPPPTPRHAPHPTPECCRKSFGTRCAYHSQSTSSYKNNESPSRNNHQPTEKKPTNDNGDTNSKVNSNSSKSKKQRRHQSASPIRKRIMNSPLLNRKKNRKNNVESSDEDLEPLICSSDAEIVCSTSNFRDLETFQKTQLRNKLRRSRGRHDGKSGSGSWGGGKTNFWGSSEGASSPRHKQFLMYNKTPLWNEPLQVYQLDFGGRVTQESAKNFQIEYKGKQVMQFGRIDGNAYTLDFQYPFSAVQAFAVALANVTQRLK